MNTFSSVGDFKGVWSQMIGTPGANQPTGVQTQVSAIAERTFTDAEAIFNSDLDSVARNGKLCITLGTGLLEVAGLYSAHAKAA